MTIRNGNFFIFLPLNRTENPCEHGSTCTNTVGSFFCSCVTGWEGTICSEDIDECNQTSGLCEHGGTCTNTVGSFMCGCVTGWEGTICSEDIDECNQTQGLCEHGGTCTNTVGSFMCGCVTGWEGTICSEDIDECNQTSGLCHNGGNCTNIPGAYRCDCPYPYTGPVCDEISTTVSNGTMSFLKTIALYGNRSEILGLVPVKYCISELFSFFLIAMCHLYDFSEKTPISVKVMTKCNLGRIG